LLGDLKEPGFDLTLTGFDEIQLGTLEPKHLRVPARVCG
jgi:hypothetical protein